VGAVSFTLFQPGDHAKLDAYLGLTNPDHHGGSGGGLGDDAEFDPDPDTTAFASYRDAVTMGKLLLLDGHGMDDVVHNLLGWPAGLSYQLYDNPFQLNHIDTVNGNVLTTVLPDVAQLNLAKLDGENSPPLASEGWLRLIDGDHAWRIDGLPVFTREFSQSNGFPLAGTGNFPLWESCLLRDKVFRVLFRDWESQYRDPNAQNFPDYGDDASHDPNEKSPKQVFDVATGTWTITGSGFDDTFTISTQLDPMGREVIQIAFPRTDFYCEDVFQQKLADVHKIVIDAGAGADSITVATNIAIPVDILGGDGDDTLTAGYVGGPSRRITFDGGGQPGDTAILSGTGSMVGVYTPDKNVQGSGKFTITGPDANMLTVDFSTLTNATASDLGQLSLVASNGKNVLGLDRPQDGRNRIKGESGGYGIALKLLDLTFFDVADVTLDTRTNNTDSNFGDAITIDRAGLVATRLKNFTVRTGPGNDVLVVHSPSFALPVPGGKFAFDAGTGGSNLQGLISLDRIEADSDVDYSLTDTDLTSSGGSRIVLSGVEGAVLTGGPGANILDASKFSGPVVLNGGPGNDTLRGGLGNNTLNGGEDADALYAGDDGFHRPGLGSQANVLQGGGGINLLRGGPGDDTLYANLYGTATLMGEGGDDSFIVTSPAGVVTDPAGGLVVVGGGQPGDILRLVGGGGPTYNQVYMVGPDSTGPHLIAEPDSLGFTPGGPDAFLPHAVAPIDHFDGEIITTNYYNRTGPTISQFLRFTGLAAIDDSLTANELTVMGASASAPIAGASGLDLASGRMRLTVGGKSCAAISFANKTKPSVLLAGGQVVTAAVPTLAGPVSAPLAVTVSTPTVAGALTTVSASTAFADTSVASVQAVTAPAATVSLDTASANPAPTVAVGSVALRFNTAKRLAGRPVAHPQKKEKAAPAAQWATNHLPKGPLGHKVASKATARPRPSAGRSNLTFPSTKAGVRSVLEKPSMHWVNRLHSATSTVSGS
jgi:hypothetical protein